MKRVKKLVSIILVFLLMVGVIVVAPTTVSAQTGGHTQAEAVAWAQSQVGKALDYDGAYGAQCVDLIAFYYRYLGNTTPGGNARDYCSNALPSGWRRITNSSGFVPQPGDICVWGANAGGNGSYGHVAIYINGNSSRINTVDQNYLNNQKTDYHSWNTAQVTCFIRPDFAPAGYNPQGCLDEVSSPSPGKLKVRGWAFDRDNLGASLAIHVYVGGPAGSGAPMYAITANKSRPDVNNAYPGVGNNHGFDDTITVSRTGSQAVYVYAINIGGGNTNPLLGSRTINIQSDTTKPTISNITVSQVTSKGYRVSCKVSDNVGVAQVKFPTWTLKADSNGNNQDDLIWHIGSLEGNIATFYVKISDHKNETGGYITDVYAYDSSNNYTVSRVSVTVTDEPKEISSVTYNGNTYKVFNSGKTWAEAKQWCEKQGGHLATITSENERIAVNRALEKLNGVPCWLGAESTSGTWKWVTGESFNFTNWGAGQPDCAGKNEFYLGTFSVIKWLNSYYWNDFPNDGAGIIGGFVCEFEKKETTTPGEVVTVYFRNNSDFLTPYAYYWTDGSIGPIDWPGVAMTKVKDDIYKVDVPVENNMIIFSDNGIYQTADLNMGEENQIYDNGWKDYEEAPTEAPTKRPTVCEHGSRITVYYPATYFDKDKTVVSCSICGKVIKKFTGSKKVLNTPKVTVKPAKQALKVKYTKVKHAQGFVVSYRIGKKTYTKTFKGNKSKTVKISNLKKGKKYSVKVRAYTISMKKKAYSPWTKAKTVKVK